MKLRERTLVALLLTCRDQSRRLAKFNSLKPSFIQGVKRKDAYADHGHGFQSPRHLPSFICMYSGGSPGLKERPK
jgi:hypothetical protein